MPKHKFPLPQEIECTIAQIPQMSTDERYDMLVELIMIGSKRHLSKQKVATSKKEGVISQER